MKTASRCRALLASLGAGLSLLSVFGSAGCASILGDEFEIVPKERDAATGVDAGMTPVLGEDASAIPSEDAGKQMMLMMNGKGMNADADLADAAGSAASDAPACATGEYRCLDAVLQVCNADLSGFATSATCASSLLCDPAQGKCIAPACDPGDHRCVGANLEQCDVGQSGWKATDACKGAPYCDAQKGQCSDVPCAMGTYQCAGNALQVCTGDAAGWQTVDMCESSKLCDSSAKKCTGAACSGGQHKCAGKELLVCNDARTDWVHAATCLTAGLCSPDSGQCLTAPCQPGDHRCSPTAPANLEVCNADQTGWTLAQTCLSAAYCDAKQGVCNVAPCQVGDYQCSGSQLQKCNSSQTAWELALSCDTPALCDDKNKVCKPPVCATSDHKCVGSVLYRCNAGRTGLEPGPTCSASELCDETAGKCNTCVPNKYSCQGADLYQCATSGMTTAKIATCQSAAACNPNLGACNQCPQNPDSPTMVNVGSFCIDSTEVTNKQYSTFLAALTLADLPKYQHPRCSTWHNTVASYSPSVAPGADNLPVHNIDWCDAYSFCKWSGKRLCGQIGGTSIDPNVASSFVDVTKDQWYAACTSGNPANSFPYGATFNGAACNGYEYNETGMINVGTAPLCRGSAAPYSGVFDMSGNVDEWEDSCSLVTTGSATNQNGHLDVCRTRGGSTYDGWPASAGTGEIPPNPYYLYLQCNADWLQYTRNAKKDSVGFRCCAP